MIRKYYSLEWFFFKKKLLPIFAILSLLFVLMAFLYYDYFIDHPERAKVIAPNYGKTIYKSSISRENEFTVIAKLFLTNLMVTFGAILLGFIPFLFLSVGPIVGLSICTGILLSGNELFLKLDYLSLLMSIVPHGIFEIPANIYASSIGIYVTIQTSKIIIPRFRSKAPSLQTLCRDANRSFILVVVPLLILAALVEVLVTPRPLYTLF